jgi:hypothetical protein
VRRADKRREDQALKEHFPGYQPHQRHRTQQEKDAQFLMRAEYRKLVRDGELPRKPVSRGLKLSHGTRKIRS